MAIQVQHFFDKATSTLSYVVHDEKTLDAVIIDPVWDFDPASGALSEKSIEPIVTYIKTVNLKPHLVLETHAHADHLSASQILKRIYPDIKVAIGERISVVQNTFKNIFNMEDGEVSANEFDILLKENETFQAGSLKFKTLFTPGHTPACASYLIEDCLFVGDALFMPDSGTGRCDFPNGSAETLYESVHEKIYALPPETRIFVCHDYQPLGRELKYQTTVGEEMEKNIQLRKATTKEEFVNFRKTRDATLTAPKLLLPSIQVNIRAGHLPKPEKDGKRFLKIPLS